MNPGAGICPGKTPSEYLPPQNLKRKRDKDDSVHEHHDMLAEQSAAMTEGAVPKRRGMSSHGGNGVWARRAGKTNV